MKRINLACLAYTALLIPGRPAAGGVSIAIATKSGLLGEVVGYGAPVVLASYSFLALCLG